jgi:hypothetical protein
MHCRKSKSVHNASPLKAIAEWGSHKLDAVATLPIRLVFKKARRDISFCIRLLSRFLASIRIQKKEYLPQVTSRTTNGHHTLPLVLPGIYMAPDTLGM